MHKAKKETMILQTNNPDSALVIQYLITEDDKLLVSYPSGEIETFNLPSKRAEVFENFLLSSPVLSAFISSIIKSVGVVIDSE